MKRSLFWTVEPNVSPGGGGRGVKRLPLTPLKPGHVTGLSVTQHPDSIEGDLSVHPPPLEANSGHMANWIVKRLRDRREGGGVVDISIKTHRGTSQ